MSPLRWTVKSTRSLAAEHIGPGHRVSADTVGNLLREHPPVECREAGLWGEHGLPGGDVALTSRCA